MREEMKAIHELNCFGRTYLKCLLTGKEISKKKYSAAKKAARVLHESAVYEFSFENDEKFLQSVLQFLREL